MVTKIDTLRTYRDSGKVNVHILVRISQTVGLLTFSPVYLKSGSCHFPLLLPSSLSPPPPQPQLKAVAPKCAFKAIV